MSDKKSWPDRSIFDVELESKVPVANEHAAFEQHKQTLLGILLKEYENGPKSKPFDNEMAWRYLTAAAQGVFRRPTTMLPARRVERLRDIENALGRAHKLAIGAMQDDVGMDLLKAWCAGTDVNVTPAATISESAQRAESEIKIAITGLSDLKDAAKRAAGNVPVKSGPPTGSGILTMHDLLALRRVYERSTGHIPVLGPGPFEEFVDEFINAAGLSDKTSNGYVIELFKYARKQLRAENRADYPAPCGRPREYS